MVIVMGVVPAAAAQASNGVLGVGAASEPVASRSSAISAARSGREACGRAKSRHIKKASLAFLKDTSANGGVHDRVVCRVPDTPRQWFVFVCELR